MPFKLLYKLAVSVLLLTLVACSDSSIETHLVDVHTAASQDIIAINFPLEITETIFSVNSEFDFSLQGLKSNGVDLTTISDDVRWSLSAGAASTIDQQGHFIAAGGAELLTLTAQFGFLSASIDIMVSAAKFDHVVMLNETTFDIDMCRSKLLKPVGRYVDDNNNEEIRPVDSTVIGEIEWVILNQEDNSVSQRAYIETSNNQASLVALMAGDIIVRAKSRSLLTNLEVTSPDFNQTVSNGLNNIKLCRSTSTDLSGCSLGSASFEKDEVLSLIAVGNYRAPDDSNFNENISKTSKWGISNVLNATGMFPTGSDRQQYNITGITEDSTATVSVACGDIDQAIDGPGIESGVSLETEVSCSLINCQAASAQLSIEKLSVSSFEVSANDISLTDDVSITLGERPASITLAVTANFSNGTNQVVTSNSQLTYTITSNTDQLVVIEEDTDSPGVFNVLQAGTVTIRIDFRDEIFIAVIVIP